MKLFKSGNVNSFSYEELLELENQFLRDELELQELSNSLEIYEAIIDCLDKEGVTPALEHMFGENVSCSSSFDKEIREQYAATENAFMSAIKEFMDGYMKRTAVVIKALKAAKDKAKEAAAGKSSEEMGFPYELNNIPAWCKDDNKYDKLLDLITNKEMSVDQRNIDELKERLNETADMNIASVGSYDSAISDTINYLNTLADEANKHYVHQNAEEVKDDKTRKEYYYGTHREKAMYFRLIERKLLQFARQLVNISNKF